MIEGSLKGSFVGSLYWLVNAKRHPTSLRGEWPEMGKACGPNIPFFVTFYRSLWPFCNCLRNWNYNKSCQITDFQMTCSPCYWLSYHSLQIGAHCSVARWSSNSKNISQARSCSPGCLPQGLTTWKWVFIWLCLCSLWIGAKLVTMRFLRTHIRNPMIWSVWKCNGLLPSVTLALTRPEEALQWFWKDWP